MNDSRRKVDDVHPASRRSDPTTSARELNGVQTRPKEGDMNSTTEARKIPESRFAALKARFERGEPASRRVTCAGCGQTRCACSRELHVRPRLESPPSREWRMVDRIDQNRELLAVVRERDDVERRLISRYWPAREYRRLKRRHRYLGDKAQRLRTARSASLPARSAGRFFRDYARYRREVGCIGPSVFEAAWIDPLSVVDLPPGDPFQFSISLLTETEDRRTTESPAPCDHDCASGGTPTSSLRKDGGLEGFDRGSCDTRAERSLGSGDRADGRRQEGHVGTSAFQRSV